MNRKQIFVAVIVVICSVLISGAVSCFSQELIQDRNFQQGFYVRNKITGAFQGPILCDSSLATPVWNTAEWGSQTSLLTISPVKVSNGICKWADNNKDFRFGPVGAEEYELYFGVNSQSEFNNAYRAPGDPWPHLLIEQRFSPPYDFPGQGPGCPPLSMLDSIVFKIDSRLLYNQTIMTTGYDPSLHAGEFLIYFTVQNLNPSSSGYGKYVWLGMQIFDDRFSIPPAAVSYDTATATLINQIPYLDFSSVSTHNGTWVHAQVDLLPYALAALDTAWANGFLNESTDPADYKIGGMNMGWELPGMNIATVGVKGISLVAYQTATGIDQEYNSGADGFMVYPNPCSGDFTVETAGSQPFILQVYNVLGEQISASQILNGGTKTMQLIDSPGIYFLEMRNNSRLVRKKLIIQK